MKNQDYKITIAVNATTQEAFNGITHVAGWWTENVKGSSQKSGDAFTVYFGETWITLEVVECVPSKKIAWLVTDCHKHWLKHNKTEWTGTKIRFDIVEQGDKTEIHFTHEGLIALLECFDGCSNAWGQYMQSLKSLINTGKGKPDLKEK